MKRKRTINFFAYLLLYFKSSLLVAQGQELWILPVRIIIEDQIYNLILGVSPGATENYDQELDQLTAPPPRIVPYAFLEIAQFPYFLSKDMRPNLDKIEWVLRIMDTQGQKVRVEWDIPDYFKNDSLNFQYLSLNDEIDMLNTNGITVEGDMNFIVTYQKNKPATNYLVCDFGYYTSAKMPHGIILWIYLTGMDSVIFDIWDRNGQIVSRWQNNGSSVRSYLFEWNGKDNQGNMYPVGVYIGKLQTKENVIIKKILLLP
ncbi:hypothetical protein MUP95_05570 [bacterium]|nr:hypothetical protein [bacterium]